MSGADPGEVKWVNFHPPFSEPHFFFFIFLSLNYWNNIWFLWHYYKNSPPISKSWIRPWMLHSRTLTQNLSPSLKTQHEKINFLSSHGFVISSIFVIKNMPYRYVALRNRQNRLQMRLLKKMENFSELHQITRFWASSNYQSYQCT